ncbi:hypothetical protein D3C85_1165680 [compost metagenome]
MWCKFTLGEDAAKRFGHHSQLIKALWASEAQGYLPGLIVALVKILQGLLKLGLRNRQTVAVTGMKSPQWMSL